MPVFEVEQRGGQLILTKKPMSQRFGFFLPLGMLAFSGACLWLAIRDGLWGNIIFVSLMMMFFAYALVPSLVAIARGGTWVIDVEKQTVMYNGRLAAGIKEIYSVRAWEESDEGGSTRRLALQPVGTKPLVISDAYTDNEWDELQGIGQRISAFTGIKLVHK
jgi:hypothetical protein